MGPWEVKSSESVFGFRVSGFGFRSSKPTLTVGFGFRVSGFAGRNQLCRPLSGSRLDVPVGTARVGKSSTTAFSSASGPHRTTIAHRSKRKKKKSWNFGSRQTISCNKPKSATGVRRRPRPPRDERKRRKQGKERLPKSQRLTRQRQRRRRRLLKAAGSKAAPTEGSSSSSSTSSTASESEAEAAHVANSDADTSASEETRKAVYWGALEAPLSVLAGQRADPSGWPGASPRPLRRQPGEAKPWLGCRASANGTEWRRSRPSPSTSVGGSHFRTKCKNWGKIAVSSVPRQSSVCKSVCVCVYRLNRRKTSITCYIYIYIYIIYIYIYAGGHRGPGGVGDQWRHLPGTRVNVPAGLRWCTLAQL